MIFVRFEYEGDDGWKWRNVTERPDQADQNQTSSACDMMKQHGISRSRFAEAALKSTLEWIWQKKDYEMGVKQSMWRKNKTLRELKWTLR